MSASATTTTTAQQLWFTAPQQVEVRSVALPPLSAEQLLVATQYSALSAGTELLVYRGQLPQDLSLDASLTSLQQQSSFPLQYGYACVGKVMAIGADVNPEWLNKFVFAFQPHASHFITTPDAVIPLPPAIEPSAALFLPNMETAVNLVQDGNPALGEQVLVMGQGIVGLLLSAILARYPLKLLCAVDGIALRREWAKTLGVMQVLDHTDAEALAQLTQTLTDATSAGGADLIYEVSGAPAALDLAITLSGYASRIIIGSWYGTKHSTVALGGAAHRNRLQISTSQVSTIAPALSGRWDKARRFDLVWDLIRQLQPQRLITHTVPLSKAALLYQQLDASDERIVQAVFTYSGNADVGTALV
jgi:2-desacetyl-2-hydroxyethyl bacteriochlorophyllide A dehydrogenase